MSASGPAARQRSTASYPVPRAIIGPGRLPPRAPAPVAPAGPPVVPPPLPPAVSAGGLPAAALGSDITMGGLGASARLAAITALSRATRVLYGTDMLASVSVAWC